MRHKWLKLTAIAAGAVLVAAGGWWRYRGCFEAGWERVQVGMTKKEVEQLLGKPRDASENSYHYPKLDEVILVGRFPWVVVVRQWRDCHMVWFTSEGRVEGKMEHGDRFPR